jgi:hypothetical protein
MISLPKRVAAFFKDPKSWKVPVAVAVVGALPLCINAIAAGELPDFSLTDLTGTFFASFAAVAFLGSLIVFYVLIAGFAARHIVNSSYPEVSGSTPDNHNYLIRGNFILGVALLSILVWFGIAAALTDLKLAPHPYAAWTIYAFALCCTTLLVLCDWRTHARSFKYSLLACLVGSLAFLAVLGLANWIGYAPTISSPTPNVTHASSTFTTNLAEWLSSAGHWLLGDRLVKTAALLSIIVGVATPVLVRGTRKRRTANRSGQKPEPWIKNETAKLLLTKAKVIGAFWFFSALTFIFLGLIVEASPASYQIVTALVGGTILLVLNFWTFSASDWKSRVAAGVCTFGFVFGVLPLYGHNITFLPKLVVNVLGLGNRHATDIALASTECPALASYGAECMPTKDTSIGLTNVNVLNRAGSSVIIEMQVQIQALLTPIDTAKSQAPVPASAVSGVPAVRVTYLPAALSSTQMVARDRRTIASLYPCDEILLEKLRESNPAKADNLACVRLSVPKEDVIGRAIGGAATYAGDFSRFVSITP